MLARAKQKNKVILVDVYTTWCGPCKMLDQRVFTNNEVAHVFNPYFLNYKADAERGEREAAVTLQTKAIELAGTAGKDTAMYEAMLQRMQRKKVTLTPRSPAN